MYFYHLLLKLWIMLNFDTMKISNKIKTIFKLKLDIVVKINKNRRRRFNCYIFIFHLYSVSLPIKEAFRDIFNFLNALLCIIYSFFSLLSPLLFMYPRHLFSVSDGAENECNVLSKFYWPFKNYTYWSRCAHIKLKYQLILIKKNILPQSK